MRKKTWILGIAAVLMAAVALLSSCYGTTPTGGTSGTTTTGSSASSYLILIGFIVVLFGLMYFLTIRPQRKRQQEQMKMITELQRGDRVITIGGLMGTIETVADDSIVIRVDSGATLRFVKSAVANKVSQETQQTQQSR